MKQNIGRLKHIITDAIGKEVGKRKLSQSAFGRICGMDRIMVNKILRGTERCVSFQKLIFMANSLNLQVNIKVNKKRSASDYKKAKGSVGQQRSKLADKNRAFSTQRKGQ